MSWRIAQSLEVLLKQLNAAFPKRSKASDGGIGDAKHASRNSDHNPWVKDAKGKGIVTARDFTHDPKTGIDCQWLADTLVENKDLRIKYIIWNKQICSSKQSPWKWRPYKGTNAHTKHLHLSVSPEPELYDSKKAWTLDFPEDESDDIAKVSAAVSTQPTSNAHNGEQSDPQSQPPTTEPAGNAPASLVAMTTPVIEVESVSAAPTEPPKEDALTQIGNKVVAVWATVGATLAAVGTWLTSTPQGIAVAIVGAVAFAGIIYMVINALRQNAKDKRDAAAKARDDEIRLDRERRAHELQLFTLKSAADPSMNTVRIVSPPTTEMPNSDTEVK